jgi:hypothetical protein
MNRWRVGEDMGSKETDVPLQISLGAEAGERVGVVAIAVGGGESLGSHWGGGSRAAVVMFHIILTSETLLMNQCSL